MATKESRLAEIFEYQKRQGRGTIGALGSALGGRALEKLDIRNLLFGQAGTPSKSLSRQIGRSIFGAGYSAAPSRRRLSDFADADSFSNVKVERLLSSISDNMANMNSKMTILAKNSIQQNRIARDINVIRQNVVLLTKKELGNARTKADMFFMRSKQREQEYEKRLAQQSKKDSDDSVKAASGKKGSFLSSVGKGLKGALAIGGLLTLFSSLDKIVGAFGKIGNYINSLWQQSKNLIDTLKNFNFKELVDSIKNFNFKELVDSIKNFNLDDLSKSINKFTEMLKSFNFDEFMKSLKNFDFSAWVNSLDKEKIAGWVSTFFTAIVQGLIAAKDLFKDAISKIPDDVLGKIFIGVAGFFWDSMKFVGETVLRGLSSLSPEQLGVVAGASAIYGLLFGAGPLGIGLVGVLLKKVFGVVGKMIAGKALASSIAGSLAGSLGGAMGCCCDGAGVPDRGGRRRGKGGKGAKGGKGKGGLLNKLAKKAAGAAPIVGGAAAAGAVGYAAGALAAEGYEAAIESGNKTTRELVNKREEERLKDDQKFVEGMKKLYPEQKVEDLVLAAKNMPPAELNNAINQLGQLYNSGQSKEVKSILERNLRDRFDVFFKKSEKKGTIADEARKRRAAKEQRKKSANAVAGGGGWRPQQAGATGTRNFSKSPSNPAPSSKAALSPSPVPKSKLKPGNYQMIAGQRVEAGKPLTEEQKVAIQVRNEMRGGAPAPSSPEPVQASAPQQNSSVEQLTPGPVQTDSKGRFNSKDDFIKGMWPLAVAASRSLGGIDPNALLTQWGVESGWGKHVSGDFNYFGIKADSSWKGKVSNLMTDEFLAGKSRVTMKQPFRSYSSAEEAVSDYVNFLKQNKRYAKAGLFEAKTSSDYFAALQRAGYATDPQYAKKLSATAMQTASLTSGLGTSSVPQLTTTTPSMRGDMFNLPSSDKLGDFGNAIINVINNNMQKAEQATSEALSSLDMDSVKDMFNPMIARATYGFTI